MGVGHYQYFSDTLELTIPVNFILPQEINPETPVLYLLHGFSDNETNWLLNTRIVKYVEDYQLAVVMPTVYQSYYSDMVHGSKYFTFMIDDLIPHLEKLLPIGRTQKNRFICGNSMGGYGAIKLGLATNLFSRAYSLSGALDIECFWRDCEKRDERFVDAFGSIEEFSSSKNNLYELMKNENRNKKVLFRCFCGKDDFLLNSNRHFYDKAQKLLKIKYIEDEGIHDWDYWDKHIRKVILDIMKSKVDEQR